MKTSIEFQKAKSFYPEDDGERNGVRNSAVRENNPVVRIQAAAELALRL